jgi:DNA-binding transcriptional regulator YiaG
MAQRTSVLKETRTRLGLSQAECATALGVAVETFRTWMRADDPRQWLSSTKRGR